MAWSEWPSPTTSTLRSLWGSSAWRIWAVGNAGTILYFDGLKWTDQSSNTTQDLISVHGTGLAAVWAVGAGGVLVDNLRGSWSTRGPGSQDWLGTWGGSMERRWAVGRGGSILHFRGDFPAAETVFTYGPSVMDGRAVFGTAADNVWVTGLRGLIVRWDGTSWKAQRSGTGQPLVSVWGSDPNTAWALGNDPKMYSAAFYRWDGSQWSTVPLAGSASLYALWGSSPNEIWAAGYPMMKWNGSTWTHDPAAPVYWPKRVFGLDGKRVWTSGSYGELPPGAKYPPLQWSGVSSQWNGSGWSAASAFAFGRLEQSINGIWVSDPSNIWIVGSVDREGGRLWGYGPVSYVRTPTTNVLNGVFGSGANNVFIVGHVGTLLRWDGSALLQQNLNGYVGNLYAVWAADGKNAWAVGDGVILQHD
jgi:hypothetical protein